MTKKKIIKRLKELGVEFNPRKTKEELELLLSNVETISDEEMIEKVEDEIESDELELEERPLEEVYKEEKGETKEEVKIVKVEIKQDTYAGKKVLSRKKIKINGIERETVLLDSLENIII